MANTYIQMYIQYIFSVKGKQNLIKEQFRDELEKVISSIVTKHRCKTLARYCNPDHTHIFVSMHLEIAPSKLMEQVKSGSSKWLNSKNYILGKFEWQKGYGAFSYSKSQIDRVVKYILNQPEHHKKLTFKEEYLAFLEKFDVEYNPKYLFEWYDGI